MTQYEFQPDGKRGRNKYVGSWTEPAAPDITLPYEADSLRQLIRIGGSQDDSTFTHQQIAQWCGRYFFDRMDDPNVRDRTVDIDVAEDISMQWELYLANTYTLTELQSLDFTSVVLPLEWFPKWIAELDATVG